MNDLEKLNRVIGSLEEQATQISEFNGILQAVNDARSDIDSSNAVLTSLSSEHKQLIKDRYSKFDDFDKSLCDLEKNQGRVLRTIAELKILSPDQFEHGRDKILLRLSELNFLTSAQYEEGRRVSNEALNNAISELTLKIQEANHAHLASLKSLKIITVLGMLALAGGIAFLANVLLRQNVI